MNTDTIMVRNDSKYVRYSSKPILNISIEYFGKEQINCKKINYEGQHWYYGKGLRPEQHSEKNVLRVLEEHLSETECGHCKS